jgi:ring-1,2-phenylacetyl-CoA epoxidase subunit PaaE
MSKVFSVKILKKQKEANGAFSFHFDITPELSASFQFKAGQYITVEAEVGKETIRRAYSISSPVGSNMIAFVVKKVKGGKMSTFLTEEFEEGGQLKILAPEGKFFIKPIQETRRQHYFVAAGSGITPIMSMIKTILEFEPKSECILLYGNRSKEDIIFHQELQDLETHYQGQLKVYFTLSKVKSKGITSWFKSKSPEWDGMVGRIDGEKILMIIGEHSKKELPAEFYVCGPGEMIPGVMDVLKKNGISEGKMHAEYFSNPDQEGSSTHKNDKSVHEVRVTLDGKMTSSEMLGEETVLDHFIKKGIDPPHSCTSGACSSCMAKLLSGKVDMDACFALDQAEIDAGYILTCQAHPVTPEVEITFDI